MLFHELKPRTIRIPDSIDLRLSSVEDMMKDVRGARLIIADPPWRYERQAGVANPEDNGIYNGLSEPEIVKHLDMSYDCADVGCRLLVWYTWPKEEEWRAAGMAGNRWGIKITGGSWVKTGQVGVGYHWRGQDEPIGMFKKGATGRPTGIVLNGYYSVPSVHSEKPVEWMRTWIRAWTQPGDLVMELYAGLAPVARACYLEGRRYVGAEIDPDRHYKAMAALEAIL